jgi:hypothetical protein
MSHIDARRGELPLIGSLGSCRRMRFRFAFWAVRRIARQVEIGARLPPTVLAAHHRRMEARVQFGSCSYAAVRRRDPHPVADGYAARSSRVGMDLDLRFPCFAPHTGDVAMLRLAEPQRLRRRQDEREALRQVGTRARTDSGFFEGWQWRVAGGQERLRVQLDLAGGRAEPTRLRVLPVARR